MSSRIVALAAACVLVPATVAAAATPVITQSDSGRTFAMRTGHSLSLRLSERYRWTQPRVTGDAVRLTPVNYVRDPGFREWTVHARAQGTARITAVGYGEQTRGCDPGPCAPRLFRVTIAVR